MFLWFATLFGYTSPDIALQGTYNHQFFKIGGFANNFANFNVEVFGYLAYIYLPLLLIPLYKFYDNMEYSFRKIQITCGYLLLFLTILIFQAILFNNGILGLFIKDHIQEFMGIFGVIIFGCFCCVGGIFMIIENSMHLTIKYLRRIWAIMKKFFGNVTQTILQGLQIIYENFKLDYLQKANKKMLNFEYSEVVTTSRNPCTFDEPLIEPPLDSVPREHYRKPQDSHEYTQIEDDFVMISDNYSHHLSSNTSPLKSDIKNEQQECVGDLNNLALQPKQDHEILFSLRKNDSSTTNNRFEDSTTTHSHIQKILKRFQKVTPHTKKNIPTKENEFLADNVAENIVFQVKPIPSKQFDTTQSKQETWTYNFNTNPHAQTKNTYNDNALSFTIKPKQDTNTTQSSATIIPSIPSFNTPMQKTITKLPQTIQSQHVSLQSLQEKGILPKTLQVAPEVIPQNNTSSISNLNTHKEALNIATPHSQESHIAQDEDEGKIDLHENHANDLSSQNDEELMCPIHIVSDTPPQEIIAQNQNVVGESEVATKITDSHNLNLSYADIQDMQQGIEQLQSSLLENMQNSQDESNIILKDSNDNKEEQELESNVSKNLLDSVLQEQKTNTQQAYNDILVNQNLQELAQSNTTSKHEEGVSQAIHLSEIQLEALPINHIFMPNNLETKSHTIEDILPYNDTQPIELTEVFKEQNFQVLESNHSYNDIQTIDNEPNPSIAESLTKDSQATHIQEEQSPINTINKGVLANNNQASQPSLVDLHFMQTQEPLVSNTYSYLSNPFLSYPTLQVSQSLVASQIPKTSPNHTPQYADLSQNNVVKEKDCDAIIPNTHNIRHEMQTPHNNQSIAPNTDSISSSLPIHSDLSNNLEQNLNTQKLSTPQQNSMLNQAPQESINNSYVLPTPTLLQEPKFQENIADQEIDSKIENLLAKLKVFKVKGDIVNVFTGPVVTTFEFRPEPDVKVSKVLGLQDDLAMALKAKSIRIQAPVPGKDVMGVEIPNDRAITIYLREILESEVFTQSRDALTIALGKDVVGEPIVVNLAKLPHLLVAGTTGSGKSVGVNAIILSLLYRNSPDDLKLMMIDPKKVEFAPYEDLPHLITPIIDSTEKAIQSLQAATTEMDKRYATLAEAKVKTILSYNEKAEEKMPFFVIIIDELADLMMTGGKEAEASIARIAQMGRAAGMHLIIATQRSSTNVVTGIIKANLPSKISYRVGNRIDSKVILDSFGAEKLLGNGDGLFDSPQGLKRIHAPWVSEQESEKIIEFIKSQRQPQYDENFLSDNNKNGVNMGDKFVGEGGILDEAKAIILRDNKTSISYIQRKLGIGYNKAANIIEALEQEGFLSPPNNKGERSILV